MLTAIIGLQWGDEGKGKIVDYISDRFDIVARYNGGNNAGHTVIVGSKELKLHLVPSAVLRNKKLILGNGMVIDPRVLVEELYEIESLGITPELYISKNAHVIMPWHIELDRIKEMKSGKKKIGTTGRGIGPCYSDKARRNLAIRMEDLISESFEEKVDFILSYRFYELKEFGIVKNENELEEYKRKIIEEYKPLAKKLEKYVADTQWLLNEWLNEGYNVLAEGAQATLLDVDHGTYPYVTSSNPTIGGVFTGLGISPKYLDKVIGVTKAYTTRVGNGPFPTEMDENVSEITRKAGHEYGATTGRPRRCGWLDLVMLKYSIVINGVDEIALTKLDVLSELDKIKVAVAYEIDGKITNRFPTSLDELEKVKPIYKEFDSWKLDEKLKQKVLTNGYEALPNEAKEYIEFIEKYLGASIKIISIGPKRNETIEKD